MKSSTKEWIECDETQKGYICAGGNTVIVEYGYWISIEDNVIAELCPSGYCCDELLKGCKCSKQK